MSSRYLIGGLCGLVAMGLGAMALRKVEPTRVASAAPRPEFPDRASSLRESEGAKDGFVGIILPEATVDIASRIEGRLASVRRQVGDTVERSEVLATLDGEALRKDILVAEAQLQAAQVETEIARISLAEAEERHKRLEETASLGLGAVSKEEVATVRYAHQVAAARQDAAHAKARESLARLERLRQDLKEAELRAPFAGVVANRFVDPGALVKPGQVLFHLLRIGEQRVRFAVPEAQARQLAVGHEVRIVLQAQGLELSGRVSHLSPEVDAAARVVLCLASLDQVPDSLQVSSGAVVRVFPVSGMTARRSVP
ncbi:hypothetical protein BO221_00610 [Archangium sp. Cb G35]|uniref:efflux RND transporter periplasmic adaptor subunit n=1 Tax=Archangium sp. Cb G35 TaxID=1920190 RepID=UPI00093598F5|nr:efflux RND transporter periplasmic adaptor subunit [Archangium sp. Cb G35]OJT26581.1 hypothetical protein BO221_00610 [Archangium sp. Cb G35]